LGVGDKAEYKQKSTELRTLQNTYGIECQTLFNQYNLKQLYKRLLQLIKEIKALVG